MRNSETPKDRNGTTDAVEILHRRFYEGKPERLTSLEETRENEEMVYGYIAWKSPRNVGVTSTWAGERKRRFGAFLAGRGKVRWSPTLGAAGH